MVDGIEHKEIDPINGAKPFDAMMVAKASDRCMNMAAI